MIENEFYNYVFGVFCELVEFLRRVFRDEEVFRKFVEDLFISLVKEEGKWYIEIFDVRIYI